MEISTALQPPSAPGIKKVVASTSVSSLNKFKETETLREKIKNTDKTVAAAEGLSSNNPAKRNVSIVFEVNAEEEYRLKLQKREEGRRERVKQLRDHIYEPIMKELIPMKWDIHLTGKMVNPFATVLNIENTKKLGMLLIYAVF